MAVRIRPLPPSGVYGFPRSSFRMCGTWQQGKTCDAPERRSAAWMLVPLAQRHRGIAKRLRHRSLTPACGGSNPPTPATDGCGHAHRVLSLCKNAPGHRGDGVCGGKFEIVRGSVPTYAGKGLAVGLQNPIASRFDSGSLREKKRGSIPQSASLTAP